MVRRACFLAARRRLWSVAEEVENTGRYTHGVLTHQRVSKNPLPPFTHNVCNALSTQYGARSSCQRADAVVMVEHWNDFLQHRDRPLQVPSFIFWLSFHSRLRIGCSFSGLSGVVFDFVLLQLVRLCHMWLMWIASSVRSNSSTKTARRAQESLATVARVQHYGVESPAHLCPLRRHHEVGAVMVEYTYTHQYTQTEHTHTHTHTHIRTHTHTYRSLCLSHTHSLSFSPVSPFSPLSLRGVEGGRGVWTFGGKRHAHNAIRHAQLFSGPELYSPWFLPSE